MLPGCKGWSLAAALDYMIGMETREMKGPWPKTTWNQPADIGLSIFKFLLRERENETSV